MAARPVAASSGDGEAGATGRRTARQRWPLTTGERRWSVVGLTPDDAGRLRRPGGLDGEGMESNSTPATTTTRPGPGDGLPDGVDPNPTSAGFTTSAASALEVWAPQE